MSTVESAEIESAISTRKTRPVDKAIGQTLRAFRLARGMSQEKLADHLGLTFQQVQKYESGANRISLGRLIDVGQALGFTLAEFETQIPMLADLSDTGGVGRTAIEAMTAFDGATQALRALGRMSAARRRSAITFLQSLAAAEGPAP